MSYWIYQFIGNLSPRELEEPIYREVREKEDAGPVLRDTRRRTASGRGSAGATTAISARAG